MAGVRIIFGAGGIGTTEKSFTYTWDSPEKITALLKVLEEHGISELDSAAGYPPFNPWNAETLLGQTLAAKKFTIDTKIFTRPADGHSLSEKNIEESVFKSLQLLGIEKVRVLHSHMPDLNTPLEETAAGFHRQYTKGKFEQLGLCNYTLDQIKEYVEICEKNGYVKPSVIQDQYNALSRLTEEFFPFMRQHGMKFNAYSPLAGGFLTGKVTMSKDQSHPNYKPLTSRTRWSGESKCGIWTNTFDTEQVHTALRKFHDVCAIHNVSETEVSLRWLAYHSKLDKQDGIILGATREWQLQNNIAMIKKGPLPDELIEAVNCMYKEANVGDMFAGFRQESKSTEKL